MKTIAIALVSALTFALVGCAAQADDENQAPAEQAEENVDSTQSSLINTSSSGGLGWSASCTKCKSDCDTDYPDHSTGPYQTCVRLCTLSGACSSKVISGGVIAY